jgi:hypothetical protein
MSKNNSQIIIYQTEDGQTKLDVRLENETIWLTQKMMAKLFQTSSQNSACLKNVYEEGELEEVSTCKEILQVQIEGVRLFRQTLAGLRIFNIKQYKTI